MPRVKETYFNWLIRKVGIEHNWIEPLLLTLNDIQFTYIIAMDENRAADGLELRGDYEYEVGQHPEEPFEGNNPSVLEVLIGIAKRLEHTSGLTWSSGDWLRLFLRNLELIDEDRNIFYGSNAQWVRRDYVEYRVSIFMDRTYDADGLYGGLFVIQGYTGDLRRMELFKQWTEYLRTLPEEPDDLSYIE